MSKAKRNAYIEKKKNGSQTGVAEHRIRQKKVQKTQDYRTRFIKPKGHFLPIAIYEKRFGNPKSKDNKKRGHQIVKAHGVKGVIMPPAEDEPWEVETSYGSALEKKTMVHDDADASDASESEASNKFDDLVEAQQEADTSMATGQSFQEPCL